jgi:hypothetical protein
MKKCKYCGKEFKAFNPKTEFEEIWERIYDKGKQKDIEKKLEIAYERRNWHALHIALWTWLSLNGEREKEEWFEIFNVPRVSNDCFACEVANIGAVCVNCPMERNVLKQCANGLYTKWVSTNKIAEREKLAREIATMKWEERI